MKIARYQFTDVRLSHQFTEAVGLFDQKCTILPELPFIEQKSEAKV